MACNHNCNDCNEKCEERDLKEKPHHMSSVKKIIGIVSGKGGVGKSLVTGLFATKLQEKGYQTGILDADITGPSIPKMFGIKEKAQGTDEGLLPNVSKTGIKIMSSNLLLKDETDPVVWRGPVIAGLVKQFWTDVIWQDIDFLFVDMPPGTGDVPLTVFQSIGVDGIIIVTSPQELVGMIVEKAVKMASMMHIDVLGIVENMSYVECPDCHKKINVFGDSKVDEIAKKYQLKVLAKLPIDPTLATLCDQGKIEDHHVHYMDEACEQLENLPVHVLNVAIPVCNSCVDEHFGKAEVFHVYQVVKGMVVGGIKVLMKEKGHEAVVASLKEHQVHVVLCNHIGAVASTLCEENGIQVISGKEGTALDVLYKYLGNFIEDDTSHVEHCDCDECDDCDCDECHDCDCHHE